MKKDIFESSQEEFEKLDTKIVIGVVIGFSIGFIFHEKFIFTLNWVVIESIALIVTAIFIAQQVHYTRQNIEISAMPNIYFGLRSQNLKDLEIQCDKKILTDYKVLFEASKKELKNQSIKEKIKTYFVIVNNSKYPVSMNVKISYEINGEIIDYSDSGYWEGKGLYVFPGCLFCPDVINLKQWSGLDSLPASSKTITAHIEYKYTPRHASGILKYGPFRDDWIYDLEESRWRGPQGIIEENLNI